MSKEPTTPLPKAIARETARLAAQHHACLHPDAEILFEDIRQYRKRRWWLATTAIVLVAGSLLALGAWIYKVGESVGTAQTQMEYMQRAASNDRVIIDRNAEAVREMERDNSTRYNQIRESLIRIESRLENIERRSKVRR